MTDARTLGDPGKTDDLPLPPVKTDQTRCFDAKGREIDCRGTGQDGDIRAGRTWPVPRFRVEKESAVDRLTGLVWPLNASFFEFPLTWEEARFAIDELNSRSDWSARGWRLPSREELFSLLGHARINPSLPAGHPFENVFPGYFWSRTPCAGLSREVWTVHLGGGRVVRGMKHRPCMLWPVRNSAVPTGAKTVAKIGGSRFSRDRRFDPGPDHRTYLAPSGRPAEPVRMLGGGAGGNGAMESKFRLRPR